VSRDVREVAFIGAIILLLVGAILQSQEWPFRTRIFPLVIAFPLLGLSVALLLVKLRAIRNPSPRPLEAHPSEVDPELARRRTLGILGWLLGFAVLIYLLGFPVGGTLGTLVYLKFGAHERWPISLAISAGTALFFVAMISGLHTPFPSGVLLEPFGL
jgi:hypothetical protein